MHRWVTKELITKVEGFPCLWKTLQSYGGLRYVKPLDKLSILKDGKITRESHSDLSLVQVRKEEERQMSSALTEQTAFESFKVRSIPLLFTILIKPINSLRTASTGRPESIFQTCLELLMSV
jgi:hypothetical protein